MIKGLEFLVEYIKAKIKVSFYLIALTREECNEHIICQIL